MMSFFRQRRNLLLFTAYADRVLSLIIFVAYPIFLITLLYSSSNEIVKAVLVPAISFIVLSLFRYFYNAKRPYEVYNFTPIIKVNGKKGRSFPSRHVFSAFVIAFCFLSANIPLGIVFLILSLVLAAVRVLCGVHFIKDVVAGMLFAAFSALVGFVII